MSKIILDQYYTSEKIACYCVRKTIEVLGEEKISEYIEPSAGTGVFLNFLGKNYLAFDIDPKDDRIIAKDFLKVELPYKKNRCIIGNPPFGDRLNLAIKFFKKAVQMGDFIAFILPISQYKNNKVFYEFDLIYSEDLGKQKYSGVDLHCCFNIYKRSGNINKKQKTKLKDIKIMRQDNKNYNNFDYDIRMCYWGNGCVGKILENENEHYSGEYKIKILNYDLFDKIKACILTADWKSIVKGIAMKRLKQYQIYEYLKEKIPGIK